MGSNARNGFGFKLLPDKKATKASGEHEIGELEVFDHELLDEEPPSQSRPSFGGVLTARAKTALSVCAGVDEGLQDLVRTVQFLSASLQGACGTNQNLLRELESLDGALDHQARDYRALSQRVNELEREVHDAEQRAREERRFLIAEQDAFIAVLVSEHERSLKKLQERLEQTERELDAVRSR